MERIIEATSDPGDVVWEPFGGLCTGAVAAFRTGRQCYSAEILPEFYALATERLRFAVESAPVVRKGGGEFDERTSGNTATTGGTGSA